MNAIQKNNLAKLLLIQHFTATNPNADEQYMAYAEDIINTVPSYEQWGDIYDYCVEKNWIEIQNNRAVVTKFGQAVAIGALTTNAGGINITSVVNYHKGNPRLGESSPAFKTALFIEATKAYLDVVSSGKVQSTEKTQDVIRQLCAELSVSFDNIQFDEFDELGDYELTEEAYNEQY